MTDPSAFATLVPGFEFLQGLVKNAGAALPGIGQWVAPTIDPAELEKRIGELRTVRFWLEQNARMIGTTIQALEVQRMTLSTLKTMNVQMEGLRDSLQIRMPAMPAMPAMSVARAEPAPGPAPDAETAADAARAADPAPGAPPDSAPAAPGVVDPLQWWGALTKQFTELASTAMRDTASEAARALTGASGSPPSDSTSKSATARARRPAAKRRPAGKRTTGKPGSGGR